MKNLLSIFLVSSVVSLLGHSYAADDAHNHDGSHPDTPKNCGTNYMLPGETARLGSHSFLILGQDGANHIIADHRSGTPPHNYHFILRIRLDDNEMKFYKKLLAESKLPPAMTTIYYDDANPKKQLDRTFFCLADLPKIFGDQKKNGDEFETLFPIRASLQKNADFEGAFEIEKSIYPGGHFQIERDDVELMIYRYLPSYLEQQAFRKVIKERSEDVLPLLSHAPVFATESVEAASSRKSYAQTDGALATTGACPTDFYLKKTSVPKTIHNFLLLSELDANTVLAVHYYDQAPHNFQTAMRIKLSNDEMSIYRKAKEGTKVPPLLQTRVLANGKNSEKNYYFCMADIKKDVASGVFKLEGSIYKDSGLNEYKLGHLVGSLNVEAKDVFIITNRNLLSLMNPLDVANDVLGPANTRSNEIPKDFVDVSTLDKSIEVEMRYYSEWNFIGRIIQGYQSNKCYLTKKAATALSKVQAELANQGLGLLVMDCYRPQRAVSEFLRWTQDAADKKMKDIFYPDEPKETLVERGYIAEKSGHSRGSTVDLTLIRASKNQETASTKLKYKENFVDCRYQKDILNTGQLDMGTMVDCLSPLANVTNAKISGDAQKNRQLLKSVMEKYGFVHYSKEWWHYTLKDEPFKDRYFDFVVQ